MAQIKKDGKTWTFRIWYYDQSGKRKSIYKSGFRKKTDAIEAASNLEILKNRGAHLDKTKITFADYFQQWIDDVKLGNYSRGTENRYKTTARIIKEWFNDTPLRDINPRTYQKFLNNYASTHAKESVQKVNTYVREMAHSAMSEQIIYVDFTYGAKNNGLPGKKESDKFLEQDQFVALKEAALKKASFRNVSACEVVFGILTGARYEEVTAVSWDRIDFDNKTVTLDRAYDYQRHTGFKPMKTDTSDRTIPITDELIDLLQNLKRQQSAQYLRTGYRDPDEMVFRTMYRTIPTGTAANTVLKELETEAKIPDDQQITFHGLRHTHASYLISNGVQISYVSKRLGHKDVATTIKVYSHLLDKASKVEEDKSIKLLNAL